jgi:hypothetical protein
MPRKTEQPRAMPSPSLLGALRDPQFVRDMRQGFLDAVNRGAIAGVIGGPVDLAALALRPFGYDNPAPFGGSEWIGQKMENAGIVSSARNPNAEFISSVAVPLAATQSIAGIVERAAKRKGVDVTSYPYKGRPIDELPTPQVPENAARVQFTPENVRLDAPLVVGRRYEGVPEFALPFDEATQLAKNLGIMWSKREELPGRALGQYILPSRTGPREIRTLQALEGKNQADIFRHELGHALDEPNVIGSVVSKQKAGSQELKEFRAIYDDLNNPYKYIDPSMDKKSIRFLNTQREAKKWENKKWTPKNDGYPSADVDSEMAAEALRYYFMNPAEIKQLYPNAAKALRRWVNNHRELATQIQLNVLGGAAVGLGAMSGEDEIVEPQI